MAEKSSYKTLINNDFYDDLGAMWHEGGSDHPIALLRAENRFRVPWILEKVKAHFERPVKALDLGCGGGILTHALAEAGHDVCGIDLSENSLEVGRRYDPTGRVNYYKGDALNAPFPDASFDLVCAMDILEHVEDPARLIREAGRLLKPDGLFFFHTFNRTWLSYLLVIKGVDWFVRLSPKNMHVKRLFIKPCELEGMCSSADLEVLEMKGFAPKIWQWPLLRMLVTRRVPEEFEFQFTSSLKTGYIGYSVKNQSGTAQFFGH